jgi:hypothetical protein
MNQLPSIFRKPAVYRTQGPNIVHLLPGGQAHLGGMKPGPQHVMTLWNPAFMSLRRAPGRFPRRAGGLTQDLVIVVRPGWKERPFQCQVVLARPDGQQSASEPA